jgi:hypothetical protein
VFKHPPWKVVQVGTIFTFIWSSNCIIVLISDLAGDLETLSAKRKRTWKNFFKYCNLYTDNDTSYMLCDMPTNHGIVKISSHNNRVPRNNLSPGEENLADFIETFLKSNLYFLILKREKAKILLDYTSYKTQHSQLKKEIRRLRGQISENSIRVYIKMCIRPNEAIARYIENVKKSPLKLYLLKQHKHISNLSKFNSWNLRAWVEWDYLTKFLPEEEVIVYAVNVMKRFVKC